MVVRNGRFVSQRQFARSVQRTSGLYPGAVISAATFSLYHDTAHQEHAHVLYIFSFCRMALIVTSLPEEAMTNQWGYFAPDVALTLNAPGMDPLHVPLQSPDGLPVEIKECTCWEWTGLAKDEGDFLLS